jgi:ATP-dependent Clp protease, protease subunit
MYDRPKPRERNLMISDRIDRESVSDTIKSIISINRDDDEMDAEYKNWSRPPILLYLNTYGGSVYDGLSLINAIETSRTPVNTIAIGSAMSMGLFILVAGHKRMAGQYSTIMYHQISDFAWDKLEGIKDQVKEAERIEKICERILYRRSQVPEETIEQYKKNKSEWYIPADEALSLGIIDEVIRESGALPSGARLD